MKVIELRAWYLDWTTKPADTRREINQALTKESFDEFLGEVNIKDLERQEAQPSVPLLHTMIQKSTTHIATNLPMQNQTGNFKVDTRDIPTLPKKGNVTDAFLKWDHLFCSKMQLAKIGELQNKSYKTLDKAKEPNAYHMHETKDNYLKSYLITATTSTNARSYIMDMSLTGRSAYFALKTAFQGEDYLNGKTVNEQSVTKTKYGRLEITWPAFDHDLIDALEDTNFVNNVVRMERKIRGSMLTTGYTNT